MVQAHLLVGFLKIYLIKNLSLMHFYYYVKLLLSSRVFNQRNDHEVSCDSDFCMNCFTSPNLHEMIERILNIRLVFL